MRCLEKRIVSDVRSVDPEVSQPALKAFSVLKKVWNRDFADLRRELVLSVGCSASQAPFLLSPFQQFHLQSVVFKLFSLRIT